MPKANTSSLLQAHAQQEEPICTRLGADANLCVAVRYSMVTEVSPDNGLAASRAAVHTGRQVSGGRTEG